MMSEEVPVSFTHPVTGEVIVIGTAHITTTKHGQTAVISLSVGEYETALEDYVSDWDQFSRNQRDI